MRLRWVDPTSDLLKRETWILDLSAPALAWQRGPTASTDRPLPPAGVYQGIALTYDAAHDQMVLFTILGVSGDNETWGFRAAETASSLWNLRQIIGWRFAS